MKFLKCTLITLFIFVLIPAKSYCSNVLLDIKVLNNFFWRVQKDINPHAQGEIEYTTKIFKDDRLGIGVIPFISHSILDAAANPNAVADEEDLYCYLTFKTKGVDLKGGFIYYKVEAELQLTPAQKRPEAGEFFSSMLLSYKFLGFNCYTGETAYFDVAQKGAAYTETVVSIDLGKPNSKIFFNVGSIIGLDFGQFVEPGTPQFTVAQLKAALNLRIAEKVFLVPNYTYVLPLTNQFEKTNIWSVSLSFR